VTKAQAEALNERAEGWAAGLYLAALSLDRGGTSVGSFGGDDRFVTDYLRAEELNRVEPAQLEFLLRTAVLEPMNASLCDAVLERDDSAQMLEQLEHENLFVVALDHQRRWFRYHHLFREMLQAELERREPGSPPRSIAEPPRGAPRTDSRRWRSVTQLQRAIPTRSQGSSAGWRARTTAPAV
jgi:LuxR family maltose regulon positive regulatory protein